MALEQFAELDERMAGQRRHRAARAQLAAVLPRDEHRGRPAAEDRIAPPLLAALDALEQERIIAAVDLAECRDRRVLVREHLVVDRHEPAAAGERAEFIP